MSSSDTLNPHDIFAHFDEHSSDTVKDLPHKLLAISYKWSSGDTLKPHDGFAPFDEDFAVTRDLFAP